MRYIYDTFSSFCEKYFTNHQIKSIPTIDKILTYSSSLEKHKDHYTLFLEVIQ